jgi:2-keto-4-pentenoate hydratase/2-oxohepta-3-ene-1,7-dioic acid hydratase in catechol pathway
LSRLDPAAPRDLGAVIKAGQLDQIAALMAKAGDAIHHQIGDITIGLPVAKPGKILCLGLNYMDHIAEGPFDKQPFPAIFYAQRHVACRGQSANHCPGGFRNA